MYEEIFIALTKSQIKMINATALSKQFKCSQSYVSRVLNSPQAPKAQKGKDIIKAAKTIVATLEGISIETQNQ